MKQFGALLLLTAAASAAAVPPPDPGRLPLQFEENRGQTDASVRYLARAKDRTLFLTPDGVVLSAAGEAVRLRFRGANRQAAIEGMDRQATVSNYPGHYPGHYPGRRAVTGVPQFAQVRYRGVWPGIDVIFYGNGGQLEYDFVIAPGADARRIRLEFEGTRGMRTEDGELVLRTASGELRQRAPMIFQGDERVRGGYAVRGRQVGFELAAYDRKRTLVIDPVLVFNARFGARGPSPISGNVIINGFDRGGSAIALDSAGNIYVAGAAYTADFPTTPGVFQPNLREGTLPANAILPNDVVIMKLNPAGTTLVYSTYLGGTRDDYATGIAVDSDGVAYVAGVTSSPDFPTTPGAVQVVSPEANAYNGFVAKISADASKLLYSSFLGSVGGTTDLRGIAIDSAHNMYVTGATLGINFPITPGAYRSTNAQFTYTAFVTKFNPAGSALVYSTYLGIANGTAGGAQPPFSTMAIAIDSAGNAYVCGSTGDQSYPTTPGAFQTGPRKVGNQSPGSSGFVTKLNATGSALVFSTYLGGSFWDGVDALALGADGSVYVAGHASSVDFPTTPGAYMTGPNPEFSPLGVIRYPPYGFVSRLKPDGSGLIYSTYVGGGGAIVLGGLAVDAQGNAYVAGAADSTSFPTTPGAIQPCLNDPNGYSNAILFKLDPNGSRLLYSTFLGGNVRDQGFAIALDAAGDAYLAGMSDSTNFVTTPGAAGIPTGQWFVAKIGLSTASPAGVTCVANTASMVPGPLAAGEVISIFGTGLGPANAVPGEIVNNNYTTSLAGTRVLFDGVAAPLLMVSGNQVNAIVPSASRFRAQTTMQVEVNGKVLATQTFDVATASPALFTLNGTGTGQAAALNQDGTINSPTNPAARGSQVTIFADSAGAWQTGMGDGLVLNDVHRAPAITLGITINGVNAAVFYLGNSPGSVTALWQINVLVPQNVFPSTAVPVRLTGPNPLTQRVMIAVK